MIMQNDEIIKELIKDINSGKVINTNKCINYAKEMNPFDSITLALKSIKKNLKEILLNHPTYFNYGQVSSNLTFEVLEELGWKQFEGSNNDKLFKAKYEWQDHIYSLRYDYESGRTIISKEI